MGKVGLPLARLVDFEPIGDSVSALNCLRSLPEPTFRMDLEISILAGSSRVQTKRNDPGHWMAICIRPKTSIVRDL
jgi:hypothetical protein